MNKLLKQIKYNRLNPLERYFSTLFDEVELLEVKYGMKQYVYSGGFAFTVNDDVLIISSNIIYHIAMFNVEDNKETAKLYFNKLFNLEITKVMVSYGR